MSAFAGRLPFASCLRAPLLETVSAGHGAAAMAAPPPLLEECCCATASPATMTVPQAIDFYVTRRLKCLGRLTGVTDMTTAVLANTEARIQAVEHLVKTLEIGSWACADHAGLRLWQANHTM
eukprot:4450102-Lingulodinium_polyedra.AAC.1